MDCSKEDLIMNDYIAYCGLDCEVCEARLATVNNDNEQSDRRAAFHSYVDIINSPAYIHGNTDMFGSDICGCSGMAFHKERKGD